MAEKSPESLQFSDLNIWLQPKQRLFRDMMRASGVEAATRLGMGGSRGSAKSGGLRRVAIELALEYPETATYVVRRVRQDLIENYVEKIKIEFPAVHDWYKAGPTEYAFPNGSRIVLKYAENTGDVDRISYGPECTWLLVDQAEQFSENELLSLKICNRWPNFAPNLSKSAFLFNVGKGIGAGYLRRIFHLKRYRQDSDGLAREHAEDYDFIHCFSWDNFEWFRGQVDIDRDEFYTLSSEDRFALFVTQTTEGRKMNALPEHRRKGELLGMFDSFSGQYFSDVW